MRMRNNVVRTLAAASAVTAALLMAPAGPASAQAPASVASDSADDITCARINFDRAAVVTDTSGTAARRVLVVSGVNPSSGVKVSLVPLTYIKQPDYWGIEVIGCSARITLPVITPYTVKLDITQTTGRIGVEVIGATVSKRIPVRYLPGPITAR